MDSLTNFFFMMTVLMSMLIQAINTAYVKLYHLHCMLSFANTLKGMCILRNRLNTARIVLYSTEMGEQKAKKLHFNV